MMMEDSVIVCPQQQQPQQQVMVQDSPFPEELWLIILRKLKDSRDVHNVLLAYPELGESFHKKKIFWLFDQVIPHISPYLIENDILTTRQICKKWTKVIDNFLQNHPRNRAPLASSDKALSGQLYLPKASPSYRHYSLDGNRLIDGILFQNEESCEKFIQHFETYPAEKNPFISRAISLIYPVCRVALPGLWPLLLEPEGKLDQLYFTSMFWPRFQEILQKFGEHVHFFEFEVHSDLRSHPNNRFEMALLCFLESLKLLPNLKSIKLTVSSEGREHRIQNIEELLGKASLERLNRLKLDNCISLTSLESLELRVTGMIPHFSDKLIRNYSTQIRRLVLNVEYWKEEEEYEQIFPNLIELVVNGDESRANASKSHVMEMLTKINSPELTSLEVELKEKERILVGNELIPVLTRFPKLNHFRISCQLEWEKKFKVEAESLEDCQVTSVESLILQDGYFGELKRFLGCFPNLRHLQIWTEPKWYESGTGNSGFTREKLYGNETGRELWNELRKLEGINVLIRIKNEDDERGRVMERKYFTREGYEYWRTRLPTVKHEKMEMGEEEEIEEEEEEMDEGNSSDLELGKVTKKARLL